MRLTTNQVHDQYLQSIASQMGTTPKNALDFLLWKLRESNYNFGQQLPSYAPQQPQQYFDPSTFERATAMSALSFTPDTQEYEVAEEIDPVISRLASLLVDQF